jgi:Domain of unknown function (DUF4276)
MTVLVLVEGPTEEAFVKNCLSPYLIQRGIYIQPIVVTTKRVLSGLKTTGGLSNGNLKKFLDDLTRMINSTPAGGVVTTLVDFYALPSNFPGVETLLPTMTIFEKISHLENALGAHFNKPQHFIPYIQMHEFEAYLFSSSSGFEEYIDPAFGNVAALKAIVAQYDNPELINGNKATSPSHRILELYPAYNKPFEGNMMLIEIGIDVIIDRCPRFKAWIESIISRK